MAYTLSQAERETTITFIEDEDIAHVFSSSQHWIRKFDKLCEENPEQFKCVGDSRMCGEVVGKFYEMDKNLVSIRRKTTTREISEEQRAEMAARLKATKERKAQDTRK